MQDQPILIWDGDCFFCRKSAEFIGVLTENKIDTAPYQHVVHRYPDTPIETFKNAVQLFDGENRYSGAHAIFKALSFAKYQSFWVWGYEKVPGFRPISDWVYRRIAQNRPLASRLTRLCFKDGPMWSTYGYTANLFLRALGGVYLIAFGSLAIQILGLVGESGIVPAQNLVDAIRPVKLETFLNIPSVFLWTASNWALTIGFSVGILASLFLVAGVLPKLAAGVCWVVYLSFVNIGSVFFHFQWDVLLLEAGFLALFLAPFSFWMPLKSPIRFSGVLRWAFWFLAFRLYFASGLVKLLSNDPNWASLRALDYHYFTQPLPHYLSWFFHHLPTWVQSVSTAVMFGVELGVVWCLFLPRRFRNWAVGICIGLQVMVLLSGNYGFFNLLSIALFLSFIDDATWQRLLPGWLNNNVKSAKIQRKPRSLVSQGAVLAVSLVLGVSVVSELNRFCFKQNIGWLNTVNRWQRPFKLINGYGLFAIMTTQRNEIRLEGSLDGVSWQPYVFKWKPGPKDRAPGWTFFHMPRLDWQMWFAALGTYKRNQWVMLLMTTLMNGSEDVEGLLLSAPFETSPNFIRATIHNYTFTSPDDRCATGEWWDSDVRGFYAPVLKK